MDKVGIRYGEKKTGEIVGHSVTKDFVTSVDGISIGVLSGFPVHTARREWEAEDQIRWARINSAYFQQLANRLEQWAATVEAQKPIEPVGSVKRKRK